MISAIQPVASRAAQILSTQPQRPAHQAHASAAGTAFGYNAGANRADVFTRQGGTPSAPTAKADHSLAHQFLGSHAHV